MKLWQFHFLSYLKETRLLPPSSHPPTVVPVSMRDAQKITAHAAVYREMPNDARTMRRNNRRVGKWPELDTVVYE